LAAKARPIFQEYCVQKSESHSWKKNAQSEFNHWAETYDQSILNHLLFHRCYLKFMEYILRFFPDRDDPVRLLDVGCGTGSLAAMVSGMDLPVHPTGLDMAERMCQLANEKSKTVGLAGRMNFVTGDSEHLPFPEGSFDIVTCSNSFHHYPHQMEVLKEMYRVLKPGGRVVIMDGFRDNVIGWFIFDVCVAKVEKSVHHCSAQEMREKFREASYIGLEQEKFGLWVPVLVTTGRKPENTPGKLEEE
jgi:ubiquinone/menaquinone biosynthesis C-methylase UbiE